MGLERQQPESPANCFAAVELSVLGVRRGPQSTSGGRCQWRRRLRHRREDTRELPALQQLASLAAAPRHLVFRGADRLLGAARSLDRQQIAVARRRDEPEHAVVFSKLDQHHAFAGTREEIDFLGLRQDAPRLRCGRDEHFGAGVPRHPEDFGILGRTRESPSRSRVVARSFTSFCRFTQPSRDTMTTLSSSTMKSSALYSCSPSSLSIAVRRLSPYFLLISSSSVRTSFHRLSSSLSNALIWRARLRFSSSSCRMIRISSRASR